MVSERGCGGQAWLLGGVGRTGEAGAMGGNVWRLRGTGRLVAGRKRHASHPEELGVAAQCFCKSERPKCDSSSDGPPRGGVCKMSCTFG